MTPKLIRSERRPEGDVDQIKNLLSRPSWNKIVSEPDDANDVILSRIVFDLIQANDHILKTKEQLAGIVSPENNLK